MHSVFLVIGLILVADTVFAMKMSNLNVGVVLPAILGVPLILYGMCGLYAPQVLQDPRIAVLIAVGAAGYLLTLTLLLGCIALTAFYALRAKKTKKIPPDIVAVLGAGLRGDRPSRLLRWRLQAAMRAAQEYGIPILAIGGKGRQESAPEAESMRKYLLEQGFPEEKIFCETKSRNTFENMRYAKQVAAPLFPEGCRLLIVTNDFHCFRTAQIAKEFFREVEMLPVRSTWYMRLNFYLRETLSILNYYRLKLFSKQDKYPANG